MENTEMKKCPYCAELIKAEAIKCRYCGSDLNRKTINFEIFSTPGYWHRVDEGKKVAGVCTGIAKQLDAPMLILPLRVFFLLTTLFWGFGIILYVILWILMPPPSPHDHATAGKKHSPGPAHASGAPAASPGAPAASPEPTASTETADVSAEVTNSGESSGGTEDTGKKPEATETAEQPTQNASTDKDKYDDFRNGSGGSGVSDAEFIEIRDEEDALRQPDNPDESGQAEMKRISSRLQAGVVAVIMIVITYVFLLTRMDVFAIPSGRLLLYAAAGLILAGILHQSRHGYRNSAGILE